MKRLIIAAIQEKCKILKRSEMPRAWFSLLFYIISNFSCHFVVFSFSRLNSFISIFHFLLFCFISLQLLYYFFFFAFYYCIMYSLFISPHRFVPTENSLIFDFR